MAEFFNAPVTLDYVVAVRSSLHVLVVVVVISYFQQHQRDCTGEQVCKQAKMSEETRERFVSSILPVERGVNRRTDGWMFLARQSHSVPDYLFHTQLVTCSGAGSQVMSPMLCTHMKFIDVMWPAARKRSTALWLDMLHSRGGEGKQP